MIERRAVGLLVRVEDAVDLEALAVELAITGSIV